jgi:hypothetical protein
VDLMRSLACTASSASKVEHGGFLASEHQEFSAALSGVPVKSRGNRIIN